MNRWLSRAVIIVCGIVGIVGVFVAGAFTYYVFADIFGNERLLRNLGLALLICVIAGYLRSEFVHARREADAEAKRQAAGSEEGVATDD